MSKRRTDRLRPLSVVSHLGVVVAVAAVMGILVAGLALPFAAVTGLSASSVAEGMDKIPAKLTAKPLSQRTRILGSNGKLLATIYDQNRVTVPLSKVAPVMRQAIVSIEDYRFYQHGALDLRGTLRAFVTNQASGGGGTQGGSSITQQMVKMTLVNQAKTKAQQRAAVAETYQRKVAELRYAIAFEEKYSKDWILERYLNIAYFGDGAYGIEAAAQHYFSVPASKLTLRQAAMLAGLVKNPSGYAPTSFPSRAKDRRNIVLGRMAELNVISPSQARRNQRTSLGLRVKATSNGCTSSAAPFFCDYTLQYLLADPDLGTTVDDRRRLLNTGGLTIKTTVDLRYQRAADKAVSDHVFPTDQAIGGMAMVVPGTGQVRALAQSRPMGDDAKKGQTYLNYVVPKRYGDANGFQAGSTFKAFVLATAISKGVPLSTKIKSPQTITVPADRYRDCKGVEQGDTWSPANSTGAGTYNLYTGTQLSVNTFFAQLEERTGVCAPATLARKMGVVVPANDVVGPFTLGVTDVDPLTMAGVYATFAARGKFCRPQPVTAVVDSAGKAVAEFPATCSQLLRQDVADAVNDVLRGVQEGRGFGAAAGLALNQPSAGKTGTINDNMAVWFDGYTPNLATSAMVAGANSVGHQITLNGHTVGGQYIQGAHGSTTAGPLWGEAMKAVEQYLPDTDFIKPDPRTIRGRMVPVPTVYGLYPQAAAAALRKAGFTPMIADRQVDSANTRGTVAYLSPGSGTSAPTGSTVTVYASDGTPYVPPKKHKPKKHKPKPKPTEKPKPKPKPKPTDKPKP